MNNIITLAHIGVGGEKGYVYDSDGIAPTLPASQYKDPFKFIEVTEYGNSVSGDKK